MNLFNFISSTFESACSPDVVEQPGVLFPEERLDESVDILAVGPHNRLHYLRINFPEQQQLTYFLYLPFPIRPP